LHLNLLIATNMRNTLPVAAVLAGLLVGVSWAFVELYSFDDEVQQMPRYSSTLLPPLTRGLPGSTLDEYFAGLAEEMRAIETE
jgi:hypothetical protein